jgi:hypothetical protein
LDGARCCAVARLVILPTPEKSQPKLSGITNPTIDGSILERKRGLYPPQKP